MTSLVTGTRLRQWLSDHPASQGAWAVFLILLSVYALTGDYDGGIRHNVDTLASSLPAQRYVTHGDMDMSDYPWVKWFVESDGRLVTNRPPGATLVAIPFYLLASPALVNSDPVIFPMAVASMFITALAMALLYLALRHLVEPWFALAIPLAYGLTTPTWSISATTLWPHGPDQLVIAGTLLAVMAGRHLWILAPLGALGVLTRPLMAVPLIVVGCWLLWRRRLIAASWLAAGGILGVGGLTAWSRAMFGEGEIGPYASSLADNPASLSVGTYAARLAGTLLDPLTGILFVSPLIPILVLASVRYWRRVPAEVRVAAVAGIVYLLAHLMFNRFRPAFRTNYRYPLETLTFLAPMAAIGFRHLVAEIRGRMVLQVLLAWGLLFQMIEVMEMTEVLGSSPGWLPWSHNP